MQETECRDARRQNVISGSQADAITLHQGHSATTARLHYQKDCVEDATSKAIEAHQAIYGILPTRLLDMRNEDEDNDEYCPLLEVSTCTFLLSQQHIELLLIDYVVNLSR